jgi:glycosyltransferase involved in cell wall biosynthesis
LRIARVLTRLNLGGPARQALASDPELMRRGHRLRLFTGAALEAEGDLFGELRERGVDVVRIPGLGRDPRPTADLGALRRLRRELDAFAPDVVHTHASKAGLLGRLASRGRGWGLVHTFHGHVLEGYFSRPVSRALVWTERRLATGTGRVLAVSERTKQDLVRLGVAREERIEVVPPGVELGALLELDAVGDPAGAEFRRACGCAVGDLLVGVIGRLAEVKRPAVALDAFRRAALKEQRLRLVFVGDGEERELLEARLGAMDEAERGRVVLAGNHNSMEPVLAACDLVLLSSRSEGMPVALIEAAAAGVPVVATPVGGVPELVVQGETGRLAEEAEGLARALLELSRHATLRRTMGRAARERVRMKHCGAELARRLESVYAGVLEEVACAS